MHVHAHHQHAHFLSVFSSLATVVKGFTDMSSGGGLKEELWREGHGHDVGGGGGGM